MKIESIIRRENGTRVTLDTTAYHFLPERPNGPHVAEVEDEEHVDTFLAIREGYRPATETATAIPAIRDSHPAATETATAIPVAPQPEPEKAEEPEQEPAQAAEKEPEKAEEPEAEAEEEPAKEPKKDAGGPPYSEAMLNEMSDDELAEEFKRLRGRKPHGNSARDTVIEVILENYATSGK